MRDFHAVPKWRGLPPLPTTYHQLEAMEIANCRHSVCDLVILHRSPETDAPECRPIYLCTHTKRPGDRPCLLGGWRQVVSTCKCRLYEDWDGPEEVTS